MIRVIIFGKICKFILNKNNFFKDREFGNRPNSGYSGSNIIIGTGNNRPGYNPNGGSNIIIGGTNNNPGFVPNSGSNIFINTNNNQNINRHICSSRPCLNGAVSGLFYFGLLKIS